MKQKFNNWLFKVAMKIIAKRIVHSENRLTPEYLLSEGWVMQEGLDDRVIYVEPNMKDRDRITIIFIETGYGYTVRHGAEQTFIQADKSIEWFEIYYMLVNSEIQYKLAGI